MTESSINKMRIKVPDDVMDIKGMTEDSRIKIEKAITLIEKQYDLQMGDIFIESLGVREKNTYFMVGPYKTEMGLKMPLSLLNNNPALLRRLDRFEQQVLLYGIRQGALKREAADQLIYLAHRTRDYSPVLFQALAGLYKKRKDVQLLQEIVTLLIKGGKVGKDYFAWYRAGVDAQVHS